MSGKTRRIAFIILAVIFAASAGLTLRQAMHYRAADNAYDSARETAGAAAFAAVIDEEPVPAAEIPAPKPLSGETQPDAEPVEVEDPLAGQAPLEAQAQFLTELDLAALQETNGDVLGWIFIPGTEVSYPYLQGEDNEHYLHTAWDGSYNYAGSVFLECRSAADLSGFNTIIYGHNMRNGSMFNSITEYYDQSFYESNPLIYLADENAVYRYEIFSAYIAETATETYRIVFRTEDEKANFINHCAEQSLIDCTAQAETNDRIITLSTCTSGQDTRWVVHAVMTGMFEN